MLQFDEVHVISDLHLGGERGFQIFGSTAELVAFIDALATAEVKKEIALVINGDFVDFLAETPAAYFDPEHAEEKLTRVMADATFAPIFKGLQKFLRTKRRTLVVNLGNHDLELALPWVREYLIRALCGGDMAARGRLRVLVDGTGVLCRVGGAKVLCVHGNEVDSWNVVDFERIRRIGRDVYFQNSVEPWIPNAGTQMVIQVMNEVKRRYPFVDLLKPEAEGVVPTLLALDPSAITKLQGAAVVAGRRAWDAARMATGFLGDAQGAPAETANNSATRSDTAPTFSARLSVINTKGASKAQAEELMSFVEEQARHGTDPMELVRGEQSRQLGFWSATWNLVTGKPTHEVLREALENLDRDRSFDIATADDTYRWLDDLVGSDIDFLVAGHTHLERALQRRKGQGFYFNSGTWARLIRITPEVRGDPAKFEKVFNLLKGGEMGALDNQPGLVTKRCSIVSIYVDNQGHTCGELRRMQAGAGAPDSVPESLRVKK
jgi:UDP-2,3-diacylglucosamine pyrophosphatase LpxH